jgi:DNA helicase-2/ATP-dependent DNA helicase PcrA
LIFSCKYPYFFNRRSANKSLWTDAGDGELIDLYEARTETDEADFVISAIQKHLDNGASANECAILYRSNVQSRVFEKQLIKYALSVLSFE